MPSSMDVQQHAFEAAFTDTTSHPVPSNMTFVADTCQSGQAAGSKLDQDKKDMAKDIDAKSIISICAAETGLASDARNTHHASVLGAAKTWPYAVMWSAVFSSTLVV